jgi:hypothetical protein
VQQAQAVIKIGIEPSLGAGFPIFGHYTPGEFDHYARRADDERDVASAQLHL